MKRVIAATPIWPPKIRIKCMKPENVATLAALVRAPDSSASNTMLPTNPMYAPANPSDSRSSTISKLFPDHEGSTWDQDKQHVAHTVSPHERISREFV